MSTTKKLYTLREAAALHGVGHVAFWRACKLANAKTQTAGNCRLITAAEAKRAATYLGSRVVRTAKSG